MHGIIKIACIGDTMPGGVLHYQSEDEFCSEQILSILKKADIRVATLETAIGDIPAFDEEKMKRDKDVIYCPTSDLNRLVALNINVVSLANNHAWDLGLKGISHAKAELDKLGIKYCGAGANLREAEAPAVVEVEGKRIAFIAFCDNNPGTCGYVPEATDDNPGINVIEEERIRKNILRLKEQYDYIFAIMHWGKEYYSYPLPSVNALARKMIDWGADGIIGSHSHQIQPTIKYKGKPIIFSLGNFFFPDRFITSPRSTFYPQSKPDQSAMPRTFGYPFVDQPTFKIWKPVARKGQIVILTVDKSQILTDRCYTSVDEDSHIHICLDKPPLLFRISHFLVRLPFYGALFFVMRGFRFIKKKIRKEL